MTHNHEWYKLAGWVRYACRGCDERMDQLPEDTCPAVNRAGRQCRLAKRHRGDHFDGQKLSRPDDDSLNERCFELLTALNKARAEVGRRETPAALQRATAAETRYRACLREIARRAPVSARG